MEELYWEPLYSSGGTSGKGSIGKEKVWKWSVIDRFAPVLNNVVDVGCGDLSFWEGRDCSDYVGIDISKTVIERNRRKRPRWRFICTNAEKRIECLSKEVVFCLDVLFHIMDAESLLKILNNLCYYATSHIFIHTWRKNPFDKRFRVLGLMRYLVDLKVISAVRVLPDLFRRSSKVTDGKYQYFRPVESYLHIFREHGFKLLRIEENPNKIGALYIFARC